MRKVIKFFTGKKHVKLEQCISLEIKKEESDTLYGGFKEYTPPIYEPSHTSDYVFKTTDLLTDINAR